MSKKNGKLVETTNKTEMVNLFKTTYYFWRFWLKDILRSGKINKARFVKDEVGYSGKIAVAKPDVDTAKKVLADYKVKNADVVEMWW